MEKKTSIRNDSPLGQDLFPTIRHKTFILPEDPIPLFTKKLPKTTHQLINKTFEPVSFENKFGEVIEKQNLPAHYYSNTAPVVAGVRGGKRDSIAPKK